MFKDIVQLEREREQARRTESTASVDKINQEKDFSRAHILLALVGISVTT